MSIKRALKLVFAFLSVWNLGVVLDAHTSGALADESYRQPQRSFSNSWGRGSAGSNRYPTTAEISQALYGTDPNQYDASESVDEPEVTAQAG